MPIVADRDHAGAFLVRRMPNADYALCGYWVQVAFTAVHISRLGMPSRGVESFGLPPGGAGLGGQRKGVVTVVGGGEGLDRSC
jgi:hypothetical protein